MKKKLATNQVQIYFYALPIGTKFIHKGEKWKKIAEEKATDSKGKEWRFEIHYGCILNINDANKLKIKKDDYRPID